MKIYKIKTEYKERKCLYDGIFDIKNDFYKIIHFNKENFITIFKNNKKIGKLGCACIIPFSCFSDDFGGILTICHYN